jgi:hypothetical protein
MCRDVTVATRYLHNTVIPDFARRLSTSSKFAVEYCDFIRSSSSSSSTPSSSPSGGKSTVDRAYQGALELLDKFILGITSDLHASGGNIRHLVPIPTHSCTFQREC